MHQVAERERAEGRGSAHVNFPKRCVSGALFHRSVYPRPRVAGSPSSSSVEAPSFASSVAAPPAAAPWAAAPLAAGAWQTEEKSAEGGSEVKA